MCDKCEGFSERIWESMKDVLAMRAIQGIVVDDYTREDLLKAHDKAHPPGKEKPDTCALCLLGKVLKSPGS